MISYDVLLAQFELFILILMRMASFIYAAPFFNTSNVPQRTKVALSFFLSIIVFSLNTNTVVEYDGVFEYVAIVLKEVVIGLILGAVTSFCVQIIMFTGKLIDMETGLSMAQIYDPTTRMQVGIFGNFYYYILMLLLMVTGMHHYLIEAIFETYKVIPIGKMTVSPSIYNTILEFMSDYFIIGFRIALPVFSATLILNVILAVLTRVAPQMNMFVVGMQLKIFVGIFAIFVTVVLMPYVSTFIESEIKSVMAKLVRSMSP